MGKLVGARTTAAFSVLSLMATAANAAYISTTSSSGFYDSGDAAVTNGENLTEAFSNSYNYGADEEQYVSTGFLSGYYEYTYVYGSSTGTYAGTVQAPTGRAVVYGYTYAGGVYGYGTLSVVGRSSITSYGSAVQGVLAADNGDSVSAVSYGEGYGGYDEGHGYAEVAIADAPTVGISNVSPYLTAFSGPVNTASPVDVQIGAASLSAFRSTVFGYASPFQDQVDFEGTLLLNGAAVGTFDDPIYFAVGSSGSQGLTDDLTDVEVNFSGITSPTADLVLNYSVVGTAYDANGNSTQTTLASNSVSEIVALPEPASLSLLATGGMTLRRRRRNLGVSTR